MLVYINTATDCNEVYTSDVNNIKFLKTMTKTTGSKQRHLADLTFKGRVERIFFFASFKLPLFNEYEVVFIIA